MSSDVVVIEAVGDGRDLPRAEGLHAHGLTARQHLEAHLESVRQRRRPLARTRHPLAPRELFLLRPRGQRYEEPMHPRERRIDRQHAIPSAREHGDGARHDPPSVHLMRVLHPQRAVAARARDVVAAGVELEPARCRVRRRRRRLRRRPAELHHEQQLLAIELRRDVGVEPRDAGNDRGDADHRELRPSDRVPRARMCRRRHDAARDEPDHEGGNEAEQRHRDDEVARGALERRYPIPAHRVRRDEAAQHEPDRGGEQRDEERRDPGHQRAPLTSAAPSILSPCSDGRHLSSAKLHRARPSRE